MIKRGDNGVRAAGRPKKNKKRKGSRYCRPKQKNGGGVRAAADPGKKQEEGCALRPTQEVSKGEEERVEEEERKEEESEDYD